MNWHQNIQEERITLKWKFTKIERNIAIYTCEELLLSKRGKDYLRRF